MKLISYSRGTETLVGVTDGVGVARLNGRLSSQFTDMLSLIEVWDSVKGEVGAIRLRGSDRLRVAGYDT